MVLTPSDIKMFLTGGTTNTNPNLSLGGNISTKEVVTDIGNNLFRRITESEAGSGVTIYRCVAIKNTDAGGATMKSVVFYMVSDTISVDDGALYSFAQAPKNVIETVIPNEFTAPVGSNINFKATLSRSGGLALGDMAPNDFVNIWLQVFVEPGAKQLSANKFSVRVEVNSEGTSGGTGGGPVPDPNPTTGVEFKMSASSDTGTGSNATTILNKMKSRGTGMIIYNGDLSYSSSRSGWLDMTSSMRSKSMVTFGNHDVDDGDGSKTTIQALFNAYGISKTYYSKIFNNVGIVVMESGENHSVAENTSSAQYAFVKKALEDFKKNPAIEWIFVANHYPIEGPRGAHHPNEDDTRDWYVPLFDANGVDVVITGHNHAMFRTKLLKYNSGSPNNPTVLQDGPNFSYSRATVNHGKLYFDVGAGGDSHYDMGSAPSYVPFMNNKVYGYLFMEFSNSGKKCTFKFYDSSDKLLDTASITHL
jgi:predicted phosphodiesterase